MQKYVAFTLLEQRQQASCVRSKQWAPLVLHCMCWCILALLAGKCSCCRCCCYACVRLLSLDEVAYLLHSFCPC
jgi:hypothetical protein